MLRDRERTTDYNPGWVNAMILNDNVIDSVFVNTREAKRYEVF